MQIQAALRVCTTSCILCDEYKENSLHMLLIVFIQSRTALLLCCDANAQHIVELTALCPELHVFTMLIQLCTLALKSSGALLRVGAWQGMGRGYCISWTCPVT